MMRSGLSTFGELKYPAGFSHFDYANPNAPKGVRALLSTSESYFNQDPQTFDTLNSFTWNGSSPLRMEYCFDKLTVVALDEPDSVYGLVAGKVKSGAELVRIVSAMGRILRALHIWVPNWYSSRRRTAYWDIFGHSETKPKYGFPVAQSWWHKEDLPSP